MSTHNCKPRFANPVYSLSTIGSLLAVKMFKGYLIRATFNPRLQSLRNSTLFMNTGALRFLWIGVSGFLGYNPSSGIAGSKGSSIFSFLWNVLAYKFTFILLHSMT